MPSQTTTTPDADLNLSPKAFTSKADTPSNVNKVALVTGGARRIGAAIVKMLHNNGYNIVLHYHHSHKEAEQLVKQLLDDRADSAIAVSADLTRVEDLAALCDATITQWSRVDTVVNNASTFYPTPVRDGPAHRVTAHTPFNQEDWDKIINTNMRAPYFLAVSLAAELRKTSGSIINLVDIYSERPLKDHSIYNISKSGIAMTTKTLARELGPEIRVNGVSPGAILWPESESDAQQQEAIRSRIIGQTPLERCGSPADICEAVNYLLSSSFVTGQIVNIDGGRSLYL